MTLRRTEYTQDIELADLINTRRESIEEGAEIDLARTALFTALRVEGRNALVVRNNLADLVGSVSLQLDGPVNDPTISAGSSQPRVERSISATIVTTSRARWWIYRPVATPIRF